MCSVGNDENVSTQSENKKADNPDYGIFCDSLKKLGISLCSVGNDENVSTQSENKKADNPDYGIFCDSLKKLGISLCSVGNDENVSTQSENKKADNPDYGIFCDSLKKLGKGVFIIGLDFHIGIIVNDHNNIWFIHSSYINRQGVLKELVQNSIALRSSQTKWVVNLTNDKEFINRWLKASDTKFK